MITDKQKYNPFELGDTGVLDNYPEKGIDDVLNINQIVRPGIWAWIKRFFDYWKPTYICRGCNYKYLRLPTKKEFRFDCETKGCNWMLFNDGSQINDL